MDKVRVFIGTEPNQWLPKEVLRWSIRRRTTCELEFRELKHIPLNLKTHNAYAFYRFSVPEMCAYGGRAIYLDPDIVMLADIEGLYHLDMQGHGALARKRGLEADAGYHTGVMLLDTEKLQHWKLSDCAKN